MGVWSIAREHPDLPAVVECPAGEVLTFSELAGRAHRLVHALRAQGIGQGEIVAYALPNDLDPIIWQLAAQESGLQAVSLNPALSAGEIDTIVEHSGASVLAVHEQLGDHVGARASAAGVRLRVAIGGAIESFTPYDELVADQPSTLPDDRSWGMPIFYSSGTTGKPKAIVRPNRVNLDPTEVADQSKVFGRAFQFVPFEGVHLVSAGMHHGGCQSFYMGAPYAMQMRHDGTRLFLSCEGKESSIAAGARTRGAIFLRCHCEDPVRVTRLVIEGHLGPESFARLRRARVERELASF